MYTLRILNIIGLDHISSHQIILAPTRPLCLVSSSSLISSSLSMCSDLVSRCRGVPVLRSVGVWLEVTCCVERERGGRWCWDWPPVSECWDQLTKYKTDWVRPHSAPASDQREREPEPTRAGATVEVIKRTLYGTITDIMTWDTHCLPPPPAPARNLDKNRIQL